MAATSWLIDKSAYVRMQAGRASSIEEWNARIERGLVRLSTVTRLELGFSVRSGDAGREAFGLPPISLMPIEHLAPAMEDRAWEVRCCWLIAGSIVRRRFPSS
ncbi:putative nucleic acid-binding protein [Nocardioides sp. BE266]|uniref:VapC toxin family PIN domain ribonuclease n=1 Tax=Nocardioides sp. BE266 TaxID=2817725 RepID=UPI0028549F46|nr:VapC toxin family PIN domain ribonuclease [Nocardioides sp. BE266]MDR7255032.1 putative nucleic acid-binding protein [Nocardioides sp. BE266]